MRTLPRIEPHWLHVSDVIETNRLEVLETREPFFVRDQNSLESACARPRNIHLYEGEADIVRLAVALLYGLLKDHPFTQGNKRTAFTCAIIFIEANQYRWIGEDDPEFWGAMVIKLETGQISEAEFTECLRGWVIATA